MRSEYERVEVSDACAKQFGPEYLTPANHARSDADAQCTARRRLNCLGLGSHGHEAAGVIINAVSAGSANGGVTVKGFLHHRANA